MQTTKCRKCSSDLPENSRFCLSCGTPVLTDSSATQTVATSNSQSSKLRVSSTSASDGRFLPGTLLAARYRIIAKLGQGGMGEVYRADDMVLGQAVALKFLPPEATDNPIALDRFRNEVKIARQVSHPNVCRVYDLGEIEGQLFLSMEYVDGEDLGVLLRRIGRLPETKALEISRKLCAGLAAAHEKGVLHRDLKPGNIMLDSHGQVLITDFGLAALAGHVEGAEVRNGTPAYMAPEQLDGKEVTVRSEVYSLGLVLYEIFTGKRPFESATLADLVRTRNESTPASPSSLVHDLDQAVERVILRCLERDPGQRPPSALAVAAALPGGDPLAAALAAGETPSPQMVAAAGDMSGLSPRIALCCLAFIVLGLITIVAFGVKENGLELTGANTPPEVLRHKAREILAQLGYTDPAGDSIDGFSYQAASLRYEEQHAGARPDWVRILTNRPRVLSFWYRESPRAMIPAFWRDQNMTPGVPQEEEPSRDTPGMTFVKLDDQSRLIYFEAVPLQVQTAGEKHSPVDWSAMFKLADLDLSQFQPAEPLWASPAAADGRFAWTGMLPGTSYPLRVEAASWLGKPVFFKLVGPWTKPSTAPVFTAGEKARILFLMCLGTMIFLVPGWLAWRNIRRGKADRVGAFRLALGMFSAQLLIWVLRAHFVAALGEFALFVLALSAALFNAALVWTMYLALEPYVRRHWPQTIISWSRLINGKLRDPAVGRDALYGVAMGALWMLIGTARALVTRSQGGEPSFDNTDYLEGARSAFGAWMVNVPTAVQGTLMFFFMLFILRVLLRNPWLAAVAFVGIWTAIQTLGGDHPAINIPTWIAIYSIAALALVRFGLVTLAVAVFTADSMGNVPLTLNPSTWYFNSTLFAGLAVLLLAVWSFKEAIAGQKIFSADLLE
jgi:tRNA A-37 threonylcarbamoyl transferase component Bud32